MLKLGNGQKFQKTRKRKRETSQEIMNEIKFDRERKNYI